MSVSSGGGPSATGEPTGSNDSQEDDDFEKPEYDSELKASEPGAGHGSGEVIEKKGEAD